MCSATSIALRNNHSVNSVARVAYNIISRRVWLTRALTWVFVTTQEVVVEPLHLTGVEMQFRRRQVQLLIGAETATAVLDIARPTAHGVRLFTRGDRKRTDVTAVPSVLSTGCGRTLPVTAAADPTIISFPRQPPTISDLPCTVSQEFRSTELPFFVSGPRCIDST